MGANGNLGNGYRWHRMAQRVAREYGAALGPSAFAVYYSLVLAADNETGTCFPSKASIAKSWGLSRRTVDGALQTLLDHRPMLLTSRRNRGPRGTFSSNDYQLLDPFVLVAENSEIAPGESPLDSSISQLNVSIVSAQNLRVVHAQNLHIPRADSARGEAQPCADSARGEPFTDWVLVREKLTGRINATVLQHIDAGRVVLDDGRIIIALDGDDRMHQVRPCVSQIATIAQRVTGSLRSVELVSTNGCH